MTTIVWKDGLPLKEVEDENAAFVFILSHQGQSFHYATTEGGYAVRPRSSYGCGADTCVDCYPFTYACPSCGESYADPVPNVEGHKLPSCDCGYEGWEDDIDE